MPNIDNLVIIQPKTHSEPYFLTTQTSNHGCPLFVFLPGMDETGKEVMYIQTVGLEAAFDVRCFVIPPNNLTNWDEMTEEVANLTEMELKELRSRHEASCHETSPVYLYGESFGGCLALKVSEKLPQLFTEIILTNPASSFPHVPWLNLGSRLFPYTPQLVYKLSSFMSLPFLVNLRRVSPAARQALLKSTKSTPKRTANQRLTVIRRFDIDENELAQVTKPVLLLASRNNQVLPSQSEAQRLHEIFTSSQMITLPHSGHTCLVENSVSLYEILLLTNFI